MYDVLIARGPDGYMRRSRKPGHHRRRCGIPPWVLLRKIGKAAPRLGAEGTMVSGSAPAASALGRNVFVERFVPKFQGRPWASGMRALHVYVLPRPGVDDDLLSMVQKCRPILVGYPIDPQCGSEPNDAGLLHLTGEMLADAPSAEYDEAARAGVVDALSAELADVPAFTMEVGPPIGNVAGAVLDVWPEADTVALIERIRTAIRRARGDKALQHSGGRPHISLGYSYGSASSDPLNSELRNEVIPRRATLFVDRVHLLDVAWDLDEGLGGWRMTWESVAEIPLGR